MDVTKQPIDERTLARWIARRIGPIEPERITNATVESQLAMHVVRFELDDVECENVHFIAPREFERQLAAHAEEV